MSSGLTIAISLNPSEVNPGGADSSYEHKRATLGKHCIHGIRVSTKASQGLTLNPDEQKCYYHCGDHPCEDELMTTYLKRAHHRP